MKKILLPSFLILTLGFLHSNLVAQEGAYVNVYGSFGLASGSTTGYYNTNVSGLGADAALDNYIIWSDYSQNLTMANGEFVAQSNEDLVKVNLGKGLNFGASFGYMFNDNFGAELGFNYLMGGKTSFTETYRDELDPNNVMETSFTGEIYATQFRINPMLVVSTDFMSLVPYAKFGVMIGIGTKINESYTDETTPDVSMVQKFDSKGGIAFGVNAVIGALYKFNKKTGLFLELSSTAMSYSPNTRTINEYTITTTVGQSVTTVNGLEDEAFPTRARVTDYVDSISETSTSPIDPTLSTLALKIKYPFSTLAFNLGVRFSF